MENNNIATNTTENATVILPQPKQTPTQPQMQPTEQNTPPKKKSKKAPIIILSVLLVISLVTTGLFGYMLFISPDSQYEGESYYLNLFDKSGLLMVKTGEKWGFIDKTGKFVINPQFDSVYAFYDCDITVVKVDDKYGYINKKGEYVINPQFDEAESFYNDIAVVKTGEKYGYIDKTGKFVINPQFDFAEGFYNESDDLACVKIDDKYGYINKKGEYVVNPQFADADYFSNGLAAVKSGDKWGYINTKGETVISYQYARAYSMNSDGYAIVMNTNKNLIIIDKEGKTVTTGEFDAIDSQDNDDICQKDGCYNYAYDDYCSDHKTSSSSTTYYPYCDAYGCYNKAYYGDYCTDHNYLEDY